MQSRVFCNHIVLYFIRILAKERPGSSKNISPYIPAHTPHTRAIRYTTHTLLVGAAHDAATGPVVSLKSQHTSPHFRRMGLALSGTGKACTACAAAACWPRALTPPPRCCCGAGYAYAHGCTSTSVATPASCTHLHPYPPHHHIHACHTGPCSSWRRPTARRRGKLPRAPASSDDEVDDSAGHVKNRVDEN